MSLYTEQCISSKYFNAELDTFYQIIKVLSLLFLSLFGDLTDRATSIPF